MQRALKWLLVAVAAALLLLAAAAAHTWYFKPLFIDAFYARVFASYALDRPQMLTSMGIVPPWLDFHSGKLDDLSPAQDEKDQRSAEDSLYTLRRYQRSTMAGEDALSYDTLQFFLQGTVLGRPYVHHSFPVTQLAGIHIDFPAFMVNQHRIDRRADAEAYVLRLDALPRQVEQVLASLQLREGQGVQPPRFAVEKSIAQIDAFVGVPPQDNTLAVSFATKLGKLPASEIDAGARAGLQARVVHSVGDKVYPAYRRLREHLSAQMPDGNHGAWHLPDGEAYYAWAVKQHTTTDLTPQQVHALGLAEVARIDAELNAAFGKLGLHQGSTADRLDALQHDPRYLFPNTPDGKQALLARYRELLAEVQGGLGDAFGRRPRAALEVKAVPAYAEAGAAIAYYSAGSVDGSRPGIFFANLRDTAAVPSFEMPNTAYHEGIPGHHFQQSIAQELTDLPFFRTVIPFTAYVEGWGLYAELLAWELGFGTAPLDNIGRLRWDLLRAVRLVVDTGIHQQRWTREQAIDYMQAHIGGEPSFVVGEVERYFVDPGQALAYKVGMLKIVELRERARQQLGAKFKLADFHDQVLGHGALPLALLERVIDDWVKRTQAGA